MKTVKIELSDDQAEALERAAADGGFASPSDLVREAIGDLISAAPTAYDEDALARDIASHRAEKDQGERGLTLDQARDWLRAQRYV